MPTIDSDAHVVESEHTWDFMDRELKFCHGHGACGVFMRGIEGNRLITDPYVFSYSGEDNLTIGTATVTTISRPRSRRCAI